MEKIFTQVLNLICNKFQYSYVVDNNGALQIDYNNSTGKAKLMIDKSCKGAKKFLVALQLNPNKTSGKVSKEVLQNLPEEKPEFSKEYTITKNKFWFDETFELLDHNNIDFTKEIAFGYEILIPSMPDYLFLWHPENGFDISIVYRSTLFGIKHYEGTKHEKIMHFINDLTEMGNDFIKGLEDAFFEDLENN